MQHAVNLLIIDIKDQLAGLALLALESIVFYLIYNWWIGYPPDLITWIVFLLMVAIVDQRGYHIEHEQEQDEA